MPARVLNLAVLVSGSGRTLQNLMDKAGDGRLPAAVKVVISSSGSAFGLKRAEKAGIPAFPVEFKKYGNSPEFAGKIYEKIDEFKIDLIILAGFMHIFPVRPDWRGKIMNIHPALIPAFCGRGYYGRKVHEAVLAYGVKLTGPTVHFVDEEYDSGPVILQSAVPVKDSDTPDSLAERVFAEECRLYPEAIRLFREGRLMVRGRRVFTEDAKR